ncbi:uncharacterized protein LOC106061158 [Biomphalaria glabrata]|uniref:Uncharacterized protein LOC106061158 n=1 Tax=Biomphalaria glabrata TaxID=6526 RepID=A0A9U8E606_BIOGL|nr:uncharacterized protein LOC106061158 [Biomphalaria glabrata]XP_055895492.1 uncharacterized protein LOC106061158 [Biomphalaria glabrata]XP_055895493.1 uncharacterized protein LOC106061158 [Biomphalaria glabrata]XP_055895495.1 uncharacterized protein LOC106061158 [Biomphalaria glabrata]XP_055895496.1 uncharacterized protein LOC106061158 [Biomphalaria glabrata]XP_055895497.1 uncharacterized protein LOC106061158 [Biomphalaria glabrata]
MSNRERRSVSLGRHRDRGSRDPISRDPSRPAEEDWSTRHNISNFLLTLQRVQTSEEENRQLRKENQILRQRNRNSRLSSSSFRGHNLSDTSVEQTILPDDEDQVIAANVKRNSLLFVGDPMATSPEHAALEVQYKKLQQDFEAVKDFLKHLFQHALTMSSSDTKSSMKEDTDKADINTYNPAHSKQLEHSLQDIHGQINQIRNSQDRQQIKMEQVQQALDNVLCQSSVRNDVTMRIVRQQDKLKEITKHASFLENQLMSVTTSLRQAEEKIRQVALLGQALETLIATNNKHLKGNTKEELSKLAEQINLLGKRTVTYNIKIQPVEQLVSHVISAASSGQNLIDTKPPAEVMDTMSKLERLIGSDWHRLGRMLSLTTDSLDDIGKFTNFDLTSKVEKVMMSWVKTTKGTTAENLRQGLDKMDRDVLLITEHPLSKEWVQLPPDVSTYCIAHLLDVPNVVNQLSGQGVLSQECRAFILSACQEHRQAARLLQSVVYMGVQALVSLSATLDRCKQNMVANKIRACLPSVNGNTKIPNLMNDLKPTENSNFQTSRPTPGKTPDKMSVPDTPKSKEKQPRKKRSRSLFTRKNKLRDSEPDAEAAIDMSAEYNYYYPAINLNVVNSTTSSSESGNSNERNHHKEEKQRQYGRLNLKGNRTSRASTEVVV